MRTSIESDDLPPPSDDGDFPPPSEDDFDDDMGPPGNALYYQAKIMVNIEHLCLFR